MKAEKGAVFELERGRSYTVTLEHTGSENYVYCECCAYAEYCGCSYNCYPEDDGENSSDPDYDYTASVEGDGLIVEDPNSILGDYDAGLGGYFNGENGPAFIHIPAGVLEAAVSGGTAGTRRSRSRLFMVSSGSAPRSADIALIAGGGFPSGRPVWSGAAFQGRREAVMPAFPARTVPPFPPIWAAAKPPACASQ